MEVIKNIPKKSYNIYTLHLSSCCFVGYVHAPQSHSYLCSRGFAPLPSRCILKSIGYIPNGFSIFTLPILNYTYESSILSTRRTSAWPLFNEYQRGLTFNNSYHLVWSILWMFVQVVIVPFMIQLLRK
ncbi:conserved hypothetical protein [Photorhabdus asymbiotica]|uniref:Uncharacterized protein n=2 Tax=Photorhabdus asymbiotica TaxID=291112 RepID=B6VL36_PHOAA|nr:hypothetical protein BDD30_3754 [Photorhabdus asymbiotica]CAQ84532.1 conserved hypothetical protein [Photorhabdus asymbiotica]CAR66866.1 Conserved Hypothetical Protein [Photorhabdus asymbiotica subsp. asymbiotica ATCC 43949]